eukprot:gene12343-15520_t
MRTTSAWPLDAAEVNPSHQTLHINCTGPLTACDNPRMALGCSMKNHPAISNSSQCAVSAGPPNEHSTT